MPKINRPQLFPSARRVCGTPSLGIIRNVGDLRIRIEYVPQRLPTVFALKGFLLFGAIVAEHASGEDALRDEGRQREIVGLRQTCLFGDSANLKRYSLCPI